MQKDELTNPEVQTIHLHKEEINISKTTEVTATVNVHKHVYTKKKKITVPVTYEEIVIEVTDAKSGAVETTRIPLSEEQVEVTKQVVKLEEVEVYKEKVKEVIQLHETLQEEKLQIKTIGEAKVQINQHSIH